MERIFASPMMMAVALDMAEALGVADHARIEQLLRSESCATEREITRPRASSPLSSISISLVAVWSPWVSRRSVTTASAPASHTNFV